MSVDKRRLAAAQRTAVAPSGNTPSKRKRFKLLASWVLIVPTLAFFSFTVVAGAQTMEKPDYAGAAKNLPKGGKLVLVQQDKSHGFLDKLNQTDAKNVLCSVTGSQLAVIATHYRVGRLTFKLRGVPVDVVTVSGDQVKEDDLRTYLGVSGLTCKLVKLSSVFYLPFDAQTS